MKKQATDLLCCLQNEPEQYRAMITTLIYTGMRRGELCGLEWSDIDFDNKMIHIQRESLYLPERGIFEDTTKTKGSERVIKVPDEVIRLLREHKFFQNTQRVSIGDQWTESGRVFTAATGAPIHPDTVSGWFRKFIEKYQLPSCSVHSLRHTNATLLIAHGTDIKTVSNRLGHANTTITGNIYSHAIKSADERASDVLQDILKPVQTVNKAE